MNAEDRKLAVRTYKERKQAMGIYAVRCLATGEVWLGKTRSLDKQRNHIWFALQLGTHLDKQMQTSWEAHGSGQFEYVVLQELEEAETAFPDARLKELLTLWQRRAASMVVQDKALRPCPR
ncbi:GIY-YIG nuclease family protein [Devosia sp.]|uniref:GIY-YIG nuclease family protein n=1 Tax=Devosia sp. TaxID=1871048 RepID=UPI003BA86369